MRFIDCDEETFTDSHRKGAWKFVNNGEHKYKAVKRYKVSSLLV